MDTTIKKINPSAEVVFVSVEEGSVIVNTIVVYPVNDNSNTGQLIENAIMEITDEDNFFGDTGLKVNPEKNLVEGNFHPVFYHYHTHVYNQTLL